MIESDRHFMQKNKPDFYIIGTGQNNTVEHFVKKCFEYFGMNYKNYIKIDKKLSKTQYRVFLGPFDNIYSLQKAFNDINILDFENIEIIKID